MKPKQTKPIFPIGNIVWFNAYVDPQAKALQFLCRGVIIRQPTETSKVYKVIPVEVFSLEVPRNPKEEKLIRSLLGKKIPKHGSGITGMPANWYKSQQKYSVSLSPEMQAEILRGCDAKKTIL